MKYVYPVVILITLGLFGAGCGNNKSAEEQPGSASDKSQPEEISKPVIEYKIFRIDDGWGFDIFVNKEKYIHQEHIPAINGLHTFKSEDDARKVAELMKQKMEMHLTLPTISQQELSHLGIMIE